MRTERGRRRSGLRIVLACIWDSISMHSPGGDAAPPGLPTIPGRIPALRTLPSIQTHESTVGTRAKEC